MAQQYIDFGYVKQHASFSRVIAGYNLKLLGEGTQRSLLCPFHPERKPSCKIDLQRNIWHCFGCGAKGNILEFVALLERDEDDLRAAALKIAALCGIATAAPRERAGAAAPAREHRRAGAKTRNAAARRARVAKAWADTEDSDSDGAATAAAAVRPAAEVLTNSHIRGVAKSGESAPAAQSDRVAEPINPPLSFELKLDPSHPYLAERGLSPATIADFGLGHCSRGVMAGRICIPIHDADGRLVAYAGRWPGDDVPDNEERYKLPAKFQKRAVLFNLHRVEPGAHVVLVEGYWSAIRLHVLGVPVAALMGSSVSPEQVALLCGGGVQFVTLLLDGDDAGRHARERVLPDLASAFFVRAPLLPDGEKPDTLAERALRALIVSPVP